MISDINKMNVKSLKKQAYLNYIIGFSKLKKKDLIKKIEIRINEEKILSQNKNILNKILNFIDRNDIINFKKTCKTSKYRIIIKKPKNKIKEYINLNKENISENMKIMNDIYNLYPSNEKKLNDIVLILKNCLYIINNYCDTTEERKEIINKIMYYISKRKYFIIKKGENLKRTIINKLTIFIEEEENEDEIFVNKLKKYKNLLESY